MTATRTEPTTRDELKRRLAAELDALPTEALQEVESFVAYQHYKLGPDEAASPDPKERLGLGGLWAGYGFSTHDLDEARREMWGNFGEHEF